MTLDLLKNKENVWSFASRCSCKTKEIKAMGSDFILFECSECKKRMKVSK